MEQNRQKELLGFLERYLQFYTEFLSLENAKYAGMLAGNLKELETHIHSEEAYQLRSRGLERERDRLMEAAGLGGKTYRDIIPFFTGADRARAQEIYEELSSVLQKMKVVNKSCQELTELKLHKLDTETQKLRANPELQRTYDKRAKEVARRPGSFSKKI